MNPKITNFVESVYRRKEVDSAFRSRMRAARSSLRETAVWGDLAGYFDITREDIRAIYVLVGSSIALENGEKNGTKAFASLLSMAWKDNKNQKFLDDKKIAQHPAVMRLRRIVSCRDVQEVCQLLGPCLQLIRSRVSGELDYMALMKDLLDFSFSSEKAEVVKARWVMDFHRSVNQQKENMKVKND